MRRKVWVSGILPAAVAALALISCGAHTDATAQAPQRSPSTASPSGPVTQVKSVRWKLIRVRGRQLVVSYLAGSCGPSDGPARASVRETATRVTVQVLVRITDATPCADHATGGRVHIKLRAPLGDRKLLHGDVTPTAPSGSPSFMRLASARWSLMRVDGRRLVASYTTASCGPHQGPAQAAVQQTDERVTVRVLVPVIQASRCADRVIAGRVRFTLRAPLANRKLVHARVFGIRRG